MTKIGFLMNLFQLRATKPSTSCFTMNSSGSVPREYTKLYIMHEDTSEFSLTASQADTMRREVDIDIIRPKSYSYDQMVALWSSSKIVIYTCSGWKTHHTYRFWGRLDNACASYNNFSIHGETSNFAVLSQPRPLIKSYSFNCQSSSMSLLLI